ncbi:hypothetical protein ACE6H2_015312 [Prunus campanulata]
MAQMRINQQEVEYVVIDHAADIQIFGVHIPLNVGGSLNQVRSSKCTTSHQMSDQVQNSAYEAKFRSSSKSLLASGGIQRWEDL